MDKTRKRAAKRNLKEVRNILGHIEFCLDSKNDDLLLMAEAFFHIFNYHLEEGDLRPSHVHLATLLRGDNADA